MDLASQLDVVAGIVQVRARTGAPHADSAQTTPAVAEQRALLERRFGITEMQRMALELAYLVPIATLEALVRERRGEPATPVASTASPKPRACPPHTHRH